MLHEIREGLIDRSEGEALVKRYDAESPSEESKKLFMDYTGLDELQLKKLCTRWANEKFFELTQGGPKARL